MKKESILPLPEPAPDGVVRYYFVSLNLMTKEEAYTLLENQKKEIKKHKHLRGESDM